MTTPEALNDGYALGLTLSAALLAAAVLIAVVVLRRPPQGTEPPKVRTVVSGEAG
jgi:hypothetical protein